MGSSFGGKSCSFHTTTVNLPGMLPLFKYVVNTAVIAPLIVKHIMKIPLNYDQLLNILGIASALNVLSNSRTGQPTPKSIFNGIFGFLAGVGFYYLIAVVFGAYICQAYERTLIWAVWMSSMTAFPLGRILGLDFSKWHETVVRRNDHGNHSEARLICGIYSIWAGAWASCIVIPLDWDRPWQKWPFPNVIGTLFFCLTTSIGFYGKDWWASCDVAKWFGKSCGTAVTATPSKRKASPAKAKASPAKSKASPRKPVESAPAVKIVEPKATPVKVTRKTAVASKTRSSRSPSKSPSKRAASPANRGTSPSKAAPSTPSKTVRSRSKAATPRVSSRLAKSD